MTHQITAQDWVESSTEVAIQQGNKIMDAMRTFQKKRPEREAPKFTSAVKVDLKAKFINLAANQSHDEADTFVLILETYPDALLDIEQTVPPEQDVRRAQIYQLAGAVMKVPEVLAAVDSNALGWVAHSVDKALDPNGRAQNVPDPVAGFIAAGEIRELANTVLPVVQLAIQQAAKELPKFERSDVHPLLRTALAIERLFWEHRLPFEVKETGFAAECLRVVYETANPHKILNRPKYWLEKAIDHPDSMFQFDNPINKNGP